MADLSKELVDQLAKSILALDGIITKLDESYKKLVTDVVAGNKALRDNKTTIDNLKKGQEDLGKNCLSEPGGPGLSPACLFHLSRLNQNSQQSPCQLL